MHLVVHRAERIFQQRGLVVVVVADDIESQHVHTVGIVQIDRIDRQLVIDHVAQFDTVTRRSDTLARLDDVGNHHIAVGLRRVVPEEILDLRVALHDERMVIGRLLARFEYEIGREGLDVAGDAFERNRQAVASGNFILGRHRQHDEMTVFEIARQRITAVGIGLRAVQSVADDGSSDRASVGRGNPSRHVGDLRVHGTCRYEHCE